MIFVDTSALFAVLDARDPHHSECTEAFLRLHEDGERLFTHDGVVMECVALVYRRLGPDAVRDLLVNLMPQLSTSYLGRRLHELARAAFLSNLSSRRSVSLVDHLSFAFMNDSQMTRAFTTDRDFERLGFEVVP